ncbi:SIS domain-containing protein [Microbacterium sp. STN6]|uniref:SIS domain-containing protein n=1 Tax=Microbacterium sp. STN6 TaxID=2995588 RepID=UPI002260D3E7|nr:SIS domain-containing protein [Microbacterium sp. STN6]MCX7523102.1 SIS domain-containing protein [Microbacterium sp. STN6]
MSLTSDEITSQPGIWREALASHRGRAADLLRMPGARVLVLGCGTSAFVAESFAALRESAGLGVTDAAYASEPWPWRDYDAVIALSRSGTTTEVIAALDALPKGVRTIAVTGVPDSPVADRVDDVLLLDFADEKSVVQTRFPTTFLLLARAAFGEDVDDLPDRAERALGEPLGIDTAAYSHFVYLGTGWTYGLAQEAALKIREAAQAWAESYPLLDYRHGPLAVADERSLVWMIGRTEQTLIDDVERVGATVIARGDDPLIELANAQRLAVDIAAHRGLNPDEPRNLTRSIVLS